jgi:hypothetical protein
MWSERSTASTFFTSQRTSDREAEMLDLRVSTCGWLRAGRDKESVIVVVLPVHDEAGFARVAKLHRSAVP